MFPHTNTSRKFPVKTHCISQSDNLLPEQRTENNHSNMPDGAIISTTSPHENLCLKRTHTILSSTITRIAKNQKIHRIFTLVAFHPDKRIDKIEAQQQSQLTKIDIGFDDAEKFAEKMMFQMSRLNSMMAGQMTLMEAVERSLVEHHQKQNATYEAYVMKEKEIVKKLDGKLDVLSGEMDQLKILVSKMAIKIDKIAIDVD